MTNWECIKEFYKEHFGIEGWVVELYANLDILQLCASGASNKSITNVCDIEEDDLVEILMNTFQFPGWSEDLPVNPYKLYIDTVEAIDVDVEIRFRRSMAACLILYSNLANKVDLEVIYNVCKTMKEIEERIADEWI